MPKEKTRAIMENGLQWTGVGSIAGVPARDLTHEEVLEYGGYAQLIASKCYRYVDHPTKENQEVAHA